MRTLFEEGDLIAVRPHQATFVSQAPPILMPLYPPQAEVQSLFSDGGVALHTRSTRYGRLGRGQLVKVPTSLVPRQKHHCVALPTHGVAVILGCNGHIWVHAPEGAPGGGAGSGGDAAGPGGDTPMDGDDGDAPQPEPDAAAQNTPVGASSARLQGMGRATTMFPLSLTRTSHPSPPSRPPRPGAAPLHLPHRGCNPRAGGYDGARDAQGAGRRGGRCGDVGSAPPGHGGPRLPGEARAAARRDRRMRHTLLLDAGSSNRCADVTRAIVTTPSPIPRASDTHRASSGLCCRAH